MRPILLDVSKSTTADARPANAARACSSARLAGDGRSALEAERQRHTRRVRAMSRGDGELLAAEAEHHLRQVESILAAHYRRHHPTTALPPTP